MPPRVPAAPPHAYLSPIQLREGIKRIEGALALAYAFNPKIAKYKDTEEAARLSKAVETALAQTFGHGTVEFNRYHEAAYFVWGIDRTLTEMQGSLRSCRERAIELLSDARSFLKDELKRQGAAMDKRHATESRKPSGSNVVIGHGRSPVWRELKDFLRERLKVRVDEFNAVPAAGMPTVARLSAMLDGAAFAFLVMTAEDAQADGKMRARENVVHEVGLFQGKLGFARAIILLEDGCEEFSNIHGLGQIRFPKANIAAKFEEVRAVLEREGVASV
ncbi:hypothetical protein E4K66_20920 [Bradyrhizobium frederickii]|uniref:CD-NTase-associated protein 12/Pycsar effector protein TIR domain-containing protein n=1 Tax=Bradyrhizobium frederickii TaxID=2560054 RepID=A0A4Y9L0R9_9BRAD|nr:hypothetical protein E4K66_20920 [Bradyrhizobium frederickii]